ncbi:snoRNA-splicing protein PRP40 NDAI_0G04600 [Naumovozyma dairenensis CBS 421]|uniref:Pre-mRNA-processing protein PRP40 n=1 Tax=Naumovozyma dairenensis (strain ATCC 10597 / BCRC 20456 / CBS 421 / NBRC 0211 / NRRL Y-12639) TaxID=1071378 RepID=J7SBP1_NAUDC|nr:hypothetical protein NDAI_0G04600 [Naumovozyma dairenensis CBS 421]CCK73445.1 hypothetical protein NDAI_0G04600 [Naumovozyma dairenensis CBS 421]
MNRDQKNAVNGNQWRSAKDAKGRIYYYNLITKESKWEKPKELLPITAATSTTVRTSTISTNNAKTNIKIEKDDASIMENIGWKSNVTADGKTYYYNLKTGESRWDISALIKQYKEKSQTKGQNQQVLSSKLSPSPATTTISVKQEIDTIGTSIPSQTAADGTSEPEELREYSNESPILTIIAKSQEDAEREFMNMLKENEVDSTWSFDKIIKELGTKDPRYWIIDDDPLWKQEMFEKYLSNRSEDQLLKEHNEVSKFKDAFLNMLSNNSEIHYYTRWPTARRIIENEPIYKHSVVSETIKKKSFLEYVTGLKSKYEEEQNKLKKQALQEFNDYLDSIITNNQGDDGIIISWETLLNNYLFEKNKRFMANKHFKILTHEDILIEYLKRVKLREEELINELSKIDEMNYTRDRIARDQFKKLLMENDSKIKANSQWKDFYSEFKTHESFQNIIGRNGSTSLDLFLDVVDDKKLIIVGKRSVAQQVLIDNNYEWLYDGIEREMYDKDYENIDKILVMDRSFQDIDKIDLQLIIDQIIHSRIEKKEIQIETEKRVLEQKKHYFKLMLHNYFRNVRAPLSLTWDKMKESIYETLEYKNLKDDEATMKQIFDELQNEIKNTPSIQGNNTVIPQQQQAVSQKKRHLTPSVELDY